MEGGNHVAYQSVEEMKNVDPRTVDRSQLVDRESVRLDPDAGYEERLKSHIRQIRNPYCYLDGGIVVKLAFQPKGPTCLLYTSPSPRDRQKSRMPSSA